MKIENNTTLITGGTSGIGRELVAQLYGYKNNLIVVSGNMDNLKELQREFSAIDIIECDLGDNESVKRLIDYCLKKHPEINVIINNAGVQYNYIWTEREHNIELIELETRINFISPMQIINGLLPILINKEESAIVNVSSALAYAPKKRAPIYCASKSAIHTATKALRYQLENTTVKVFEIVPPLVDTNMTTGRGKGKISPKQLVDTFLINFKKNKFESNIGKAKLLRFIQRISPTIADNILKNS